MPEKYTISIKTAPPRFQPVGKYTTIEFREQCAGSCRECVKKRCVYDIFKETRQHISTMDEPEFLYTCMSCFRCVQECTKGIFSRVINPEYRSLGDEYWRSDIIHRTWYQAHTGKIPVSGAGYRGPFVGRGFDSMWTDMSEIVRPTRDGIHGREYINTCIELSRRKTPLIFTDDCMLAGDLPPIFEIPIPLLFQQPAFGIASGKPLESIARAAETLGTMLFIKADACSEYLHPYLQSIIPCLSGSELTAYTGLVNSCRVIELADDASCDKAVASLRVSRPDLIVCVGTPLTRKAADRAVAIARMGADTIHLYADDHGNEIGSERPRFLKEMIREVHLRLVKERLRQRVKLIFSGGIAMAEHMAKAVICGADGVTIDNSLLIALECRLCRRCEKGKPCPVQIDTVEPEWGCQRIMNLVGAWRNQLLEVMGAMGIREARRLRGEVGRSLWFEDLERENFGPLFGERKVEGLGL